ncbi:hypothetical protein BSKO_01160 [Bryopsis sp. KO-2023]|nr:hypothetical protein BSKO_01160 [Bryopsis sp. KO-2023]
MECKAVDSDFLFRLFTKCPDDLATLIFDVRNQKYFKKRHVNQAFCVRLSSNGKALVDYSKSEYKVKWSQGVWWGKEILVYGDAGLKKSHPVIDFLLKEGQCKRISYHKEGYDEFEKRYPFLCTPSLKPNSVKSYPSQIVPNLLYLGDLGHAASLERLSELNIKSVVTIHNHPERTKFPAEYRHLRLEMPDIEVADISQYFNAVYGLIEDARAANTAVLVHCGAGVSRSSTLCVAYLMRKNLWSLEKANDHCKERRSRVSVNQGFWNALRALEVELGIDDGCKGAGKEKKPSRVSKISKDAAGGKVEVKFSKKSSEISDHRNSDKHHRRDDSPKKKRRRHERERESSERLRSDSPVRHRHDPNSSPNQKKDGQSSRKRTRSSDPVKGKNPAGDSEPGAGSQAASGMKVGLEVSKGGKLVGNLEIGALGKHQRCIFGRAPGCDVKLEHLSISRQHAQLEASGNGVLSIMDLGSGHGTNADGVWLRAKTPRSVKVGSTLRFGASTRTYKVVLIG